MTDEEFLEVAKISKDPLGIKQLDDMFDVFGTNYYYRFMFHLAKKLFFNSSAFPVYVELGTYYGYSAAHFIAGCGDSVRAYGIDHTDQVVEPLLSNENFILIKGDTTKKKTAQLFNDKSIDVLFIDSHHTYDVMSKELELWSPKVKDGGIILCDDIYGRLFSCSRLWKELPYHRVTLPELHAGGWGFGIIPWSNSCAPYCRDARLGGVLDTAYENIFSSNPSYIKTKSLEEIAVRKQVDATLYIDVWGDFFRSILSPRWFIRVEENCGCSFEKRVVCVNNISPELVEECQEAVVKSIDRGDTHDCVYAFDEAVPALAGFNLVPENFFPLGFQSIADLVAIKYCTTKYIVFFSGDSAPWGSSNWVSEGIKILEERQDVFVVNPVWNGNTEFARNWSNPDLETEHYFLGYGFSDQCYLARTADLKADIYHETNPGSEALYCKAHGNQFEKRVDAWMRNHGKMRATLKRAAYITRP